MSKTIISYFTELARRHGACPAGVGWSKESQQMRFRILTSICAFDGISLLDAGCGYGELWDVLQGFGTTCDYTGIDLTPAQIELARTRHHGDAARFRIGDALSEPADAYDYVIASGPINVGCQDPDAAARDFLHEIYRICRRGCAMTLISTRAPVRFAHIHYHDPAVMLTHALSLTPLARLDHSYLPHDFAVFCFKPDCDSAARGLQRL